MKDAVSYRPDIDGLRAIAVLAVVVFHASPVLLPGGFVGVDVFFVISGFLISRIIFEKLEQGNFSFSGFYAARVRRIFPALLVVLAVCLVMGWLALLPDEFSSLGQHVLASAAFVQNVVLWQEAGYFDVATELKPLMHLWSLAVEEQFYIVYPLLIWAAWRLGWPVLPVITVLGVASFGMNLVGMSQDPAQTFFLTHTRVWELLVGAAIARFAVRGWHVPMPWANLLSGAGLLLLVASGVLVHQGRAFPGAWALLPVLGAGALILAGSQACFNRRFLVLRPVVFIGLISYPLYLWHWPLLSFARIMENGTPAVWIRVIAVALSLMLAWLTWKFVETPIRFGTATRFKIPALVLGSFLLAGTGYLTYLQDGYPGRADVKIRTIETSMEFQAKYRQENRDCQARFPEFVRSFCLLSKPDQPEILLLGDSHAYYLFPGLSDAVAASGKTLAQFGASGCPIFFDTERFDKRVDSACHPRMRKILTYAEQDPTVQTVILLQRGPLHIMGTGFGEPEKHQTDIQLVNMNRPDLVDNAQVFEYGMRETLRRFAQNNKKVIFVLDNPELHFDPKSCISSRPLRLTSASVRSPCAVSQRDFEERNRVYRNIVNRVLLDFPKVKLVDASIPFCDGTRCWAKKGEELYYLDSHHLSSHGVRLVAKQIVEKL